MLELKNIYKTFGKNTLDEKCLFDDFNLSINKEDFVTVVGSNGSGKTTILNIISGDMDIDSGSVLLADDNITKLSNYKRATKIARVFQNPSFGTSPSMTIFENMSVADNKGKLYGLTKGLNLKRKEYYQSLLSELGMGLENRMNSKAGALSGGQRQAMALIMATITDPEILLLDEHTAALDPKSADIVMELTERVVKNKKLTTIMVTHNLRYAVEYGSRIVMLHNGKSVIDMTGDERKNVTIEYFLEKFNEISVECGN